MKVNKNNFEYSPYVPNIDKYCKNFKKIYNDFSNITKENRERFNIEIKEVSLEKENNDSLDISKDDMELII